MLQVEAFSKNTMQLASVDVGFSINGAKIKIERSLNKIWVC
jgi:hypothetical protein